MRNTTYLEYRIAAVRPSVQNMSGTTSNSVRLSPPPPALMRVVNPVVRRLLASRRLGRRFARQGLIEYTGRRTGRVRRVPVCLHEVAGETLVFTGRPWRWNFADGAPVTVTVTRRGRPRAGHAVLLDAGAQQTGAALREALDAGATPFELGLKVASGHQPTADELAAISGGLGVVRIDFDTDADAGDQR